MQLRIFTSLVTVFQFFIAFSFGNDFVIYRNRSRLNQIWESWDSFRIPSSTCQQTTQGGRCVPFAAAIDSKRNCSCLCPSEKSTFVFHEREWICLDNLSVRDLQGDSCSNTHYLLSETDHLPDPALSALSVGDVIPTNILHGLDIQHCDVNPNSSWYLGCNGMPLFSSQHLRKIGELFAFKFNSTASSQYFVLEVKRGVQNTELLQGRVINLGILCRESGGHQYHGCIQIKLKGKLTCPVVVPNLQPSSSAMPKNTSIRAAATSSKMGLTTSIIVSASSKGSKSSKPISTTSIIVSEKSTGIHPTSTVFRSTFLATQSFSNSSQTILLARHPVTRSTALQSSLGSGNTTESVSSKIIHTTTIIASATWAVIRSTSIVIRPPTIPTRIFSSPPQTRLKLSFTRSIVSLPSANHPISKVNRPSSIDTRIISSTLQTSFIFHIITRSTVLHQSTFVLPLNVHLRPRPNVEGDAKGSSSSLGFIAGISISIFLAVVMIGITGLIFYLRCYTGKWYHEQKDHQNTVMMSIHRNLAFREDDENEYNSLTIRANGMQRYASIYSRPRSPAACEDIGESHIYETIHDSEEENERSSKEPSHRSLKEPEKEIPLEKLSVTGKFEKPVSSNLEAECGVFDQPHQKEAQSSLNNGAISSGGQTLVETSKTSYLEPEYHVLEEDDLENIRNPCDYHHYGASLTGKQSTSGGSATKPLDADQERVCPTSERANRQDVVGFQVSATHLLQANDKDPKELHEHEEILARHSSLSSGGKSSGELNEAFNCDKKPAYKVLEGPCIRISVNPREPVFPKRSPTTS